MPISGSLRVTLLEPPKGRVRVVMDTDAFNEIDDQFAIVQMMLSHDRFDVEAIYAAPFFIEGRSSGPGDGMEQSYDEILRLLERLSIPEKGLVHKGVSEYVGPEKLARDAPAVDDLISRARSATPEAPLYVIAIAAISNIASAIIKAPEIVDRIFVVWLGGHALEWPHTQEFNLLQDVGGAQVLFDSGVPLVWVPVEGVTSNLHSTVPEIERYVEPCGAVGAFLAMRFKEYSDVHKGWSKRIWDMAAVGWLLNSDWAPSVLISAPILTDQMTWSRDHRRHQIRYVTCINRDAMFQDLIGKLEKLADLPSST
jgi:hypothetical protein